MGRHGVESLSHTHVNFVDSQQRGDVGRGGPDPQEFEEEGRPTSARPPSATAVLLQFARNRWARRHGRRLGPSDLAEDDRVFIQECYASMDPTHQGRVTVQQVAAAVDKTLGIGRFTEAALLEALKDVDVNGDGVVSWSEFRTYMAHSMSQRPDADLVINSHAHLHEGLLTLSTPTGRSLSPILIPGLSGTGARGAVASGGWTVAVGRGDNGMGGSRQQRRASTGLSLAGGDKVPAGLTAVRLADVFAAHYRKSRLEAFMTSNFDLLRSLAKSGGAVYVEPKPLWRAASTLPPEAGGGGSGGSVALHPEDMPPLSLSPTPYHQRRTLGQLHSRSLTPVSPAPSPPPWWAPALAPGTAPSEDGRHSPGLSMADLEEPRLGSAAPSGRLGSPTPSGRLGSPTPSGRLGSPVSRGGGTPTLSPGPGPLPQRVITLGGGNSRGSGAGSGLGPNADGVGSHRSGGSAAGHEHGGGSGSAPGYQQGGSHLGSAPRGLDSGGGASAGHQPWPGLGDRSHRSSAPGSGPSPRSEGGSSHRSNLTSATGGDRTHRSDLGGDLTHRSDASGAYTHRSDASGTGWGDGGRHGAMDSLAKDFVNMASSPSPLGPIAHFSRLASPERGPTAPWQHGEDDRGDSAGSARSSVSGATDMSSYVPHTGLNRSSYQFRGRHGDQLFRRALRHHSTVSQAMEVVAAHTARSRERDEGRGSPVGDAAGEAALQEIARQEAAAQEAAAQEALAWACSPQSYDGGDVPEGAHVPDAPGPRVVPDADRASPLGDLSVLRHAAPPQTAASKAAQAAAAAALEAASAAAAAARSFSSPRKTRGAKVFKDAMFSESLMRLSTRTADQVADEINAAAEAQLEAAREKARRAAEAGALPTTNRCQETVERIRAENKAAAAAAAAVLAEEAAMAAAEAEADAARSLAMSGGSNFGMKAPVLPAAKGRVASAVSAAPGAPGVAVQGAGRGGVLLRAAGGSAALPHLARGFTRHMRSDLYLQ